MFTANCCRQSGQMPLLSLKLFLNSQYKMFKSRVKLGGLTDYEIAHFLLDCKSMRLCLPEITKT